MDALAAREAYLYGYYGVPDKLLSRHPLFYTALPDSRQQEIYDIGKNARDRQIETKWQKIQEKKKAALAEADEFADLSETADVGKTAKVEAHSALEPYMEKIVLDESANLLEQGSTSFVLEETDSFKDSGKEHLNEEDKESIPVENHERNSIINIEASALPDRFKKYIPKLERRREIITEGIELQRPIFDRGSLGQLAGRLRSHEDYYDVVLHGTAYSFEYFGEPIDVETLCAIIAQRKDYKKGTKIRLIACNSGTAADGVARYISNKLHVTVLAPDKKAIVQRLVTGETIVYSGSKIGVHDGKFIPFVPDNEVDKNETRNDK